MKNDRLVTPHPFKIVLYEPLKVFVMSGQARPDLALFGHADSVARPIAALVGAILGPGVKKTCLLEPF